MSKRKRQGGEFCAAINCSNARYKENCAGMSFFRFPKDEERCKIWVQYTRRQDILGTSAAKLNQQHLVLCSKHFEANQFNVPSKRKRLVWNAVPTLFDVPNPPSAIGQKRKLTDRSMLTPKSKACKTNEYPDLCCDATSSPSTPDSEAPEVSDTKLKTELHSRLKYARNKLYRLKSKFEKKKVLDATTRKSIMLTELRKCLPKETAQFVETQLRVCGKKTGRRWTDQDKALALSLFHASPKAYRILLKLFTLPFAMRIKDANFFFTTVVSKMRSRFLDLMHTV